MLATESRRDAVNNVYRMFTISKARKPQSGGGCGAWRKTTKSENHKNRTAHPQTSRQQEAYNE
jgi:hypothetical protein